ncbi:NADP-dependent alcohol hydrogenase, putative [Bodo saltans]|uniref:NADP-dependent alcohol hydrogenase, putative n=1 Tax=Bodo saltans TaxID=75058 RepID=A0A0S4JG37_BODSA|nr:NADP-dependent alcohol hydrogenase, putative [Bodo saltans]|eukprot:CUG89278.1 NADP-dependent alcohol hydrogenase, putative [Bodo saltans]
MLPYDAVARALLPFVFYTSHPHNPANDRGPRAFAAFDATTPLGPFTFPRRAVGSNDVKIDIKFCGVCSSDLHKVGNEWKNSKYPMVPGHEIVGVVEAVGPDVTKFKVGDTVGVGCLVDSCLTCGTCNSGLEQFCEKGALLTYNAVDKEGVVTKGGYSDHIVVRQEFDVRIPDNLPLAAAAPLLCAGITSYSPLRHWNVQPGDKIGVVGLGGLGGMAVKFAMVFGAHVTVFTTTSSKVEFAKKIGADDVAVTSDPASIGAVKGLRFILDTASVCHDLNPYINTLKHDGTMVLVGAPENPHPPVIPFGLIFGRRSLTGSAIGGIAETQEMLDFCGKHNIVSEIELIPTQDINKAYDRMRQNAIEGRFVIDNASLKQ